MRSPVVNVLIRPSLMRFNLLNGDLIYHFCTHPDTSLDEMDKMMGIDPQKILPYDCNLGFLPVCSTVLVRGEKTLLIDPGNFHVGFYGILKRSLSTFNLTPDDIDSLVVTHGHHDHFDSCFLFRKSLLYIGEGELDFSSKTDYWPEYMQAMVSSRVREVRTIPRESQKVKIMESVHVLPTPGHTPGSVSVLIQEENNRTAVIGDTALTREGYLYRKLEHWNSKDMNDSCNKSLDLISSWSPTRIIPGHDEEFCLQR